MMPDWKHGRVVHLLSQAEKNTYLLLRWNDEVEDIREQFPLVLDDTNKIADMYGYQRVNNGRTHMTTDLLVTFKDGTDVAVSVKKNEEDLKDQRTYRKLEIERCYWENRNIEWVLVIEERDIDVPKAKNIFNIIGSYNENSLREKGKTGLLKHLLAHKVIVEDMSNEFDFPALVIKYKDLLDRKAEELAKAKGIII